MVTNREPPEDFGEDGLEAMFAEARAEAPPVSSALFAAIMADAEHVLDGRGQVRSPGPLAAIWQAIGGWPALSGLATAAAAGIWIGVAAPEILEAEPMEQAETGLYGIEDIAPGFADVSAWLSEEGGA